MTKKLDLFSRETRMALLSDAAGAMADDASSKLDVERAKALCRVLSEAYRIAKDVEDEEVVRRAEAAAALLGTPSRRHR